MYDGSDTEAPLERTAHKSYQTIRSFVKLTTIPPPLVLGEQLGRRVPARFFLEIDIRPLLPGAVDYDKARF
jgi:hypothetical protein